MQKISTPFSQRKPWLPQFVTSLEPAPRKPPKNFSEAEQTSWFRLTLAGGKRMAAAAIRPRVVDFFDGILTGADRTVYVEEFLLSSETCPKLGQTLGQAQLRSEIWRADSGNSP
jgi:hypothetical protein